MADIQEDNEGEVQKKTTAEEEDLMRDSKSSCHPLSLPKVTRRVSSCGPTDVHRADSERLLIRLCEEVCRLCLFWIRVGGAGESN